MPGPAGADDPALDQARLAQLAPRAYADAWLCRYMASAGAPRPAPHAQAAAVQGVTPPVMQQAAQRAGDAEAGAVPTRAGTSGATAADGSVQTAEAKQAARPKPVPPTLAPAQRDAAMSKARLLNSERKEIRDQLQQGSLSLAQALAQDEEAARGMRVVTVLRALPGIGAATAARLMREAGMDAARRVGALTTGQAARLLAAVAAVDAEMSARRDRLTGHARPDNHETLRDTTPADLRDRIFADYSAHPVSRCG
jgi:ribosomal protein S13